MEDLERKGLVLVEVQRISDLMVELEVVLTLQSTAWSRIYSAAQEIAGHAGQIMRLCKAHSKAEAITTLETWKATSKKFQTSTRKEVEKAAP